MKILHINSHYSQGGAARIAAYLHTQLREDGEESYLAFGRGPGSEESSILRFDRTWEIYMSALLSRLTGINGWWNRRATKRLIKWIGELKPDIIHLHVMHGYYLNFSLLFHYLNEENISCVWTFHDCHAFTGNCGYFFECGRWKEGCGSCPHIHNYPKSQFWDFTAWMWKQKEKLFTGCEKIIVTPSDWLTNVARQSFLGKYECVTIRHGIDTEHTFYPRDREYCRKKYGYTSEEKLVLGISVGFDDPRKGAKYILKLAENLKGEARVILIGWNKKNDGLLAGVDNVITIASTGNAELLAEYYSLSDVFVIPSLAEAAGLVLLESMACGTPVVGFDAGGIPEHLTGGRGIAVPTGDQAAFDNAVRRALETDGGSGLLRGQRLAECIRRENSLERMTAEYRKIYERLGRR